jgi:hypothetical protein
LCTEFWAGRSRAKTTKINFDLRACAQSEKKLEVLKQLSVDRKTVHQHHGSQESNFLGSNDVFVKTQKTEASHYGGQ